MRLSLFVLFLVFSWLAPSLFNSHIIRADDYAFDWDLVSLEQNNNRFNGSVLSGFHSIRSAGVTPDQVRKLGLGLLYSHEELLVRTATDLESFDNDRLILNPKLNYGLWDILEFGGGLELNFANGKETEGIGNGLFSTEAETEFGFSAVVGGVKWQFFSEEGFRLAASFDTRLALQAGTFGMLEASFFNFELDGDVQITDQLSLIANLQLISSDRNTIEDLGVLDLAAAYGFNDKFRGMVFTTISEDDEAQEPVFYFGVAGQVVHEVHSFTFALDFQLNDVNREIEAENQIDLEFSYTITF